MKAVRVNADYELALFSGNKSPEIVNHSLEYLYWFLGTAPIFTSKTYDPSYLVYVAEVSGRMPVHVSTGDFQNWWGALSNLPLERELNSKLTSAKLSKESQIISNVSDIKFDQHRTWLAKNPCGMSGQGFVTFTPGDLSAVAKLLSTSGKVIVEPLFDRVYDFSHYVLRDRIICYENLVDKNFQYKGTLFSSLTNLDVSHLSFATAITREEWKNFETNFEEIRQHYKTLGADSGYSIDSFIYKHGSELKIRSLSEVNYRRTMGLLAYELSQKFAPRAGSSLFVLGSPLKRSDAFSVIKEGMKEIAWDKTSRLGVLQLSPGDTRFESFLICGESVEEVKGLYGKLKNLLPDCKFAVHI